MSVLLRSATLEDVRHVRNLVLQPPAPSANAYDGDDAPDTLHLGAWVDGRLVAVATICQDSPGVWRLRGMASLPEWQGRGLGRQLSGACLAHAREHGGQETWCSARIETIPFYRSLGFEEEGDPFTLPQYSDRSYVVMRLRQRKAQT